MHICETGLNGHANADDLKLETGLARHWSLIKRLLNT